MTNYEKMIAQLYAIITACARGVQADMPFHTVEGPTEGEVVPVDETADETTRQFDIRMTDPPQDDGSSGYVWQRFRVGLELRIRYPISPRSMMEALVGDDTPRLVNALISPPNWEGDDSVIRTIPPPARPRWENLINDNGAPFARLLVIPFEVVYTAL